MSKELKALRVADVYPWPRGVHPECQKAPRPEVFYPMEVKDLTEALGYCSRCPITAMCYSIATTRGEDGVWGGRLLADGKLTQLSTGSGQFKKQQQKKKKKASVS